MSEDALPGAAFVPLLPWATFMASPTGLGGGSQLWALRSEPLWLLRFVAGAITVSLERPVYAKSYTTHLTQLGLKVFSTNSRCRG